MKKFTYLFTFFVFLSVFFLTASNKTIAQSWQTLGSGTGGDVNAMVVYNGNLIVAGTFSVAGGQLVNHIASWDGNAWQSLGLGTNDDIYALTVQGGLLVAGGRFTTAGGIVCNKIARWNGTSWASTGSNFNGDVYTLAVQGSYLVAGGSFTSVNNLNTSRIARYLNTWQTMGFGFDGNVNALAIYNTVLYAGGNFDMADSIQAKKIARWDGSRWATLGVGMDDGGVYCLRVFNNSLYAGGTFTGIGGSLANRIARWNGTSWANVGFGFSAGVYALHSLGTILYAGGDFDYADFLPASKIASNSGTGWVAMGSGIGGSSPKVKAIYAYFNDVMVGGHFLLAGGQSANNIAKWGIITGINPVNNIIPESYELMQNYPNPFNPSTKIRFSTPYDGYGSIILYDSKGAKVKDILKQFLISGKYELNFNAADIPGGVYFYKFNINGFSDTKKMILIK